MDVVVECEGRDDILVELPDGATVGELRAAVAAQWSPDGDATPPAWLEMFVGGARLEDDGADVEDVGVEERGRVVVEMGARHAAARQLEAVGVDVDVHAADEQLAAALDAGDYRTARLLAAVAPEAAAQQAPQRLGAAIAAADMDRLEALLRAGLDPNAPAPAGDSAGFTALHFAAYHNAPAAVRAAAAHAPTGGLALHRRDGAGRTALHYAAQYGHREAFDALVAAGADVNARTSDGWTALHIALDGGGAAAVRAALAAGGDVAAAAPGGRRCVHLAAAHAGVDALRVLLAAGADAGACDDDGWGVLHHAAARHRGDVIRYVLSGAPGCLGVDVEQGTGGLTALHVACRAGALDAAAALLAHGACGESRAGVDRHTPAHVAVHDAEMMRVLMEARADGGPGGAWDVHELLVYAAAEGALETLCLLADWGGGAAAAAADADGNTPLHAAAAAAPPAAAEAVAALARRGAALDAVNADGDTPLFVAVRAGRAGAAAALVRAGAAVDDYTREYARAAGDCGVEAALRGGVPGGPPLPLECRHRGRGEEAWLVVERESGHTRA